MYYSTATQKKVNQQNKAARAAYWLLNRHPRRPTLAPSGQFYQPQCFVFSGKVDSFFQCCRTVIYLVERP